MKWSLQLMGTLFKDIRYGITSLRKHPGFSIIVVVVLAVGIGANSAVFSVVNGVLLRPLPYRGSDRLVMVWGNFTKLNIDRLNAKAAEYEDYRAQNQIFEQVAAFDTQSLNLAGDEQAERLVGGRVTANLFPLLGAQAEQGRALAQDENQIGHDNVVVLSHGFWQRRFGGKDTALGQHLRLNDQDYTVIGVMPPSFQFPLASLHLGEPADIVRVTGEHRAVRGWPADARRADLAADDAVQQRGLASPGRAHHGDQDGRAGLPEAREQIVVDLADHLLAFRPGRLDTGEVKKQLCPADRIAELQQRGLQLARIDADVWFGLLPGDLWPRRTPRGRVGAAPGHRYGSRSLSLFHAAGPPRQN